MWILTSRLVRIHSLQKDKYMLSRTRANASRKHNSILLVTTKNRHLFNQFTYNACCMWICIHYVTVPVILWKIMALADLIKVMDSVKVSGPYAWRSTYKVCWNVCFCYRSLNLSSESVLLVTRTLSSFFDQGCSYLAQRLPIGCRWQKASQITHMTWESKVKVTYTKICLSGW